ncbi:MAG: OmpA family protein [Sneathiellales bacterium]|nr:OmpA family protein [Sneathiellales bacterium]
MTIQSSPSKALVACAFCGSLLAACGTTEYENLTRSKPAVTPFSKSLSDEYKAFAKSEIDQYDWPDQQLIARKGLEASREQQPLPEQPDNWRLSQEDKKLMANYRQDLIHWLNTDGRFKTPKQTARAQARFDCWIEQKEENWQREHIKACQDSFKANLPEISTLHFGFDRSDLTAKSLETLQSVASDWRQNPADLLMIQGHADQIGDMAYNYRLARKRAFTARSSLINLGIPSDRIQVEVWGESRPRQEHSGKTSRGKNRRVEIFKFQ